ncbi:MAG: hypothetical protein FIA94_12210 [Nitrospirae bacterium]|nr:hypothetical protein [Nitrospirota bacterium]
MIRRQAILIVMVLVSLLAAWKFYVNAISYNPLDEGAVKHTQIKEGVMTKSVYAPAWDKDIHDKNLFSPTRTYKEPKPVSVMPPVEPPKRPEMVLKGIVLDTYGDYVAYLEINQAKAVPLRKGDKVDEIEVSDISEKKVVLKWNNENITMSIEKIKTISTHPRTGK